jgi:hypothetical protein
MNFKILIVIANLSSKQDVTINIPTFIIRFLIFICYFEVYLFLELYRWIKTLLLQMKDTELKNELK